ncbi:MAG TPA: S1/P1 nuclease [Thermoanaerobaculia bacterium]|nr:S1/P1 nuclease [Thermoanaerobaculia bacterium]
MRKILVVLALLSVCSSSAYAWSAEGHRIVCRIAYDQLTAEEQHKVDALVKGYKTPPDNDLQIESYADACVFPDVAAGRAEREKVASSPWLQYKQFKRKHFINVDRGTTMVTESACHDDCVLSGIASQAQLLKSGATEQERAEGLIFLGHFVGDVHQPLHVSFESDQGGNLLRPITGGFYPIPPKREGQTEEPQLNLHSVWDGAILRKVIAEPGWKAFADALSKKITAEQKSTWAAAPPLEWAQESYDITTLKDMQYCKRANGQCEAFGNGRVLGSEYQQEFLPVVETRLQEAGVRLAAMIHEALAH